MFVSVIGRSAYDPWGDDTHATRGKSYASYVTFFDLYLVEREIKNEADYLEEDKRKIESCPLRNKEANYRAYQRLQLVAAKTKTDAAELWCPADLSFPRSSLFNLPRPWNPSGLLPVKPLQEGTEKRCIVNYIECVQDKLNTGAFLYGNDRESLHIALNMANRDLNTICERRLAFCMATHARLGAPSPLSALSPEILLMIAQQVYFQRPYTEVDPPLRQSIATRLRNAWDGLMSILGLKRRRH